jgi:predicted RNA binding protein YcfA (HicA-like mRNA interferase family)
MSGRAVCRIMTRHGFEQVRQKGSHLIMQKKEGNSTITVPVPDHDELRMGTLLGINGPACGPGRLLGSKNQQATSVRSSGWPGSPTGVRRCGCPVGSVIGSQLPVQSWRRVPLEETLADSLPRACPVRSHSASR